MKHPTQEMLALHAGGDLGRIAGWRTDRHLARCERCREEFDAFADVRAVLPDLNEIPEVAWNRLASEMKANIRLGLAAGECVRAEQKPLRETLFSHARVAVALASVVALLVTGVVLEHPVPRQGVPPLDAVIVQSTREGIQVRDGAQALQLLHTGVNDRDVIRSVGAQGSMRARYVDPETGYVTINNVYAE
jgi:predicted anti-sigma-YlaC factor YlaD